METVGQTCRRFRAYFELGSPLSNTNNNASPAALVLNFGAKDKPHGKHHGLVQALSSESEEYSLKKHEESSTSVL